MADNKVNFLRGTSTEYEAATKDNDTFYYTTDDGKLYLGNKEITGGNIVIDDALSDTSENPVQNKVVNVALNSKLNKDDITVSTVDIGEGASLASGKFYFVMDKINNTVSVDKTSLSLNTSKVTDTITVNRLGTGAITAISSDDTIVSTSVSDNIITVTGLKKGNTTVTISIDEDETYLKPDDIIISVECSLPRIITDMTPEEIKNISDSGQAANYFSVGDMIPITLSGTVAETSISGTYYATIIGINHNSSKEDSTGIDFIIDKDSNGKDIAFCDSKYNKEYSDGGRMVMNTSDTNSGGWNGSYMNSTICPQFLNIIPTEWQSVIKSAKKYTDNTGGGSDNAGNVTLSQSKIWLLSEYEVQGARSYANSTEQNYQLQYDYYKNGNSKKRYKHTKTSSAVDWWLRSPYYYSGNHFCSVGTVGNAYGYYASFSLGFAPCFRI